ncbi:MAG: hypothetical protein WBG11_09520 [Methylocella sp.]
MSPKQAATPLRRLNISADSPSAARAVAIPACLLPALLQIPACVLLALG